MADQRLRLDRRSRIALHQQLYDRIRGAIEAGVMMPGERLASARSLAAQASTLALGKRMTKRAPIGMPLLRQSE